MNELMKFKGQSEGKMSSREIAELTGKTHGNVMVDIRKLIQQLPDNEGELKFQLAKYVDGQGKKRPVYHLNKEQSILLISGYDAMLRLKIIRRWAELEAKQLPQTYKQAIQALLQSIEREEQLSLHVNNLETALDSLVEWVSIIKVAQFNNVHENRFNWRKLKQKSIEMGFSIKKAESPRFGYQNLYHTSVFKMLYPRFKYNFIND